ncbi:MAG: SPOR domain-containing protein [Halothiobacillaceae bacterium]
MSNQDTPNFDPLMDATFSEPSMQERAELITHLLRHSDRVFTIMSDDATVLSGFSHKLTHHDTKGLYYAEVYPSPGMDAEDMVMHLARGWGVEVDFGETAMNALFQRLPALLPDPRRAVAIIHFADTLPPMILDGLISFMQRLDQLLDGRVRLILTGSSQLTQRIAPMQTLGDAGQIYALHLQPLSTQASPAQGFAQGFVSVAAAEMLDEPHTESAHTPEANRHSSSATPNPPNARGLIFAGLGISLILAVIVAMLLRPDAPEAPKETTVSIPLMPAQPSAEPAPASTETIAQVTEPQAAPATAPAPVVTETPPAQPNPTQPSVYSPVAVSVPSNPPATAAPPEPKPAASTETTLAKPVHATKVKETAPETKSNTPKGERFAASNATNYVLQIITVGSAKAANDYVKTHGLKDCQTFRQQRDGKDLYSLTCGLYPSRDAAIKAQQSLPASVLNTKPYPRQVADIRKVMLH